MKYVIGFILLVGSPRVSFSQIRDTSSIVFPTDSKPLIVLDGKVLSKLVKSKADSSRWVDPISEIDPKEIDNINVIRNERAVALYGELGRNGVVEITMKNPKKN